jgi:ABC-2 type transport system ATP-binding protein
MDVRSANGHLAIQVRGLCKNHGGLAAVKGIDFDVIKGEIFGLIGPDGAGKTSTFQVLGGVMQPTSGTAEIFGQKARDARALVGYVTQSFGLYQDLSVAENLSYIGELRHLTRSQIEERSNHYLEMFDMHRFNKRLAGKLSGGMKQKLALACALIAQPKVLLLDEPTSGVDPVSRRGFWDTLADLSSEGMTIIVATPYLDEAERCHRVALMFDGLIHDSGNPAELKMSLGLNRLEVRADNLARAEDQLLKVPELKDVQRFGDRLDVMVPDTKIGDQQIREVLASQCIDVQEIRVAPPTLESSFVAILRNLHGDVRTPPFPSTSAPRERTQDRVAIGARELRKTFGSFQAVKGISIEIKYGEIYGLLGANGAGKTTTIKMLCGLLKASSGQIELAGESGWVRSSFVRQQIGYMSQKFSLYDDLTINENLDFFAGVYQVPPKERKKKKEWVLEFSGLTGREYQLTGHLPIGWKQRVAFGAAVMHEPSVLFLDEPTSGVDPLARRAFWRMINVFADRGVAILLTTHYLEEAEQCNRLGLMVAGELVAEGSPSGIKEEQGGHLIEVLTDAPQRAANTLKLGLESWRVSLFGDRLHVVVDEDVASGISNVTRRLYGAGIKVHGAYEERYSLEDVFIIMVEKARRHGLRVDQ